MHDVMTHATILDAFIFNTLSKRVNACIISVPISFHDDTYFIFLTIWSENIAYCTTVGLITYSILSTSKNAVIFFVAYWNVLTCAIRRSALWTLIDSVSNQINHSDLNESVTVHTYKLPTYHLRCYLQIPWTIPYLENSERPLPKPLPVLYRYHIKVGNRYLGRLSY